ncbi:MAG TPA: helix-turn-helix transcriptional regulator [Kineosporiaceae bacterium]|jgi:DNA-binding NarL/FixJ family response regulator|nr:helix-turn-helix transcriptional regulator [Kineosporiaceae bacterium]
MPEYASYVDDRRRAEWPTGHRSRAPHGGAVLDFAVETALRRARPRDPLQDLSPREREILGLMAEGLSNAAICGKLRLSPRTVESHIRAIFIRLGLFEAPDTNRRVLAVLAYLGEDGPATHPAPPWSRTPR